jgi:iron complex transport system substrate-binding protein
MPSGAARLEGPMEEPLFVIWMYQTMHPEAESSINLRDKIKSAFIDMYHYELSEKEIDEWLRLDENLLSYGYEQFQAHH